jgi:FMN-dependent NADH-azoreductase
MSVSVLNIQSSPRGAKSASIAVTKAFLDAYHALHSDVTIDTLNVWEEHLPDFDQEAIGAKYKGVNKQPMDQAETAVWDKIQEPRCAFSKRLASYWAFLCRNFAYPYKLKQLIDLVCQRNMLFTYDGKQYGPLLKTPCAFVVYARGGTYAEDSPTAASQFDHQRGYIDFWLKFIGIKEVRTLVAEGTTWGGKEKGEGGRGRRAWSEGGNKVGGRFLRVSALIAPEFSRVAPLCQRPVATLICLPILRALRGADSATRCCSP